MDTAKIEQALDSLQRHKTFAQNVRTAPLAFWNVGDLNRLCCVCCDSQPSHISTYPFFSSGSFARQIILWCSKCGFGMVPGTSFPLEDYYRSQYATDNRGDREIDPAEYFASMDLEEPPKNLARYIGRAKTQHERILKYVPRIGSMLDVGAGPGYALKVSGAERKFALEYDAQSEKYLDFLGATIVNWRSAADHNYDVVLLSHSLEHFQYSDVLERLEMLVQALNPGGVLYIEVPPGGLGWKHYNYKHEPHTLFFTPEALERLGKKMNAELAFCGPTIKTFDRISDREDAIYEPETKAPYNDPRGSLTLILRKPD